MDDFVYKPENAKIGFGTQSLRDLEKLVPYLKAANQYKYDFVDCAWRYGNEAIIGLSLKTIKKNDMSFNLEIAFQSKVWPSQFLGGITKSLKFTLQKIGAISAIDSYMLHRPSLDINLNLSAWCQLIDCKRSRLAKKIGLGNFDKDMIEQLFKATNQKPEFLQFELSINNMRYDRISYCKKNNIEIQAYEPLGNYEKNLKNKLLISLAKKYNTNIKNLLIAFLLNQEIIVIICPENEGEIKTLIEAKKIILEKEDLEEMKKINTYENKHFETTEIFFKGTNE